MPSELVRHTNLCERGVHGDETCAVAWAHACSSDAAVAVCAATATALARRARAAGSAAVPRHGQGGDRRGANAVHVDRRARTDLHRGRRGVAVDVTFLAAVFGVAFFDVAFFAAAVFVTVAFFAVVVAVFDAVVFLVATVFTATVVVFFVAAFFVAETVVDVPGLVAAPAGAAASTRPSDRAVPMAMSVRRA